VGRADESPYFGVLPIGNELDAVLPDGGLLRGAVVELAVSGAMALATSIALGACRAAQEEGQQRGAGVPWCAFIDPSKTLYGPGVAQRGVMLDRLLIVQPPLEALGRAALRVVESQVFSVVVIDTAGTPGAALEVSLGVWPRLVRRMSMAVEATSTAVLLITDSAARRPLALPVAQRIELERPAQDKLVLRVAKDRLGRVSAPRSIAWTRPEHQWPEPAAKSVKNVANHDGARHVRLLA
jgi:recombination protein RecA